MIEQIYYEDDLEEHPGTQDFFRRFPQASKISCNHYKEIFNPSGQNFRLQKKKPSLILAKQRGKRIHSIPESYGVGGRRNYYFSHLFNCLYDCRYCFLQGMFPSANYVLFLNYDDFWMGIQMKTAEDPNQPSWFFSGYDCDSLAMESTTGFVNYFIPRFATLPEAFLELRTKSVNIRFLLEHTPTPNVVVAFSFTPQEISQQLEHGVPSVSSRIKAMNQLAVKGWNIGIRIDPVIECIDFEKRYSNLFQELFVNLPANSIHSVSLGAFRMPANFFKKIEKLYPNETLLAGKFEKTGNAVSYRTEIESNRLEFCYEKLLKYIPSDKLFNCEIQALDKYC